MDLMVPTKLGDIERITIEERKGLSFWGNINLPIERYEYAHKNVRNIGMRVCRDQSAVKTIRLSLGVDRFPEK